MDTRTEMETELIAQLQVANNSSLFPSTRITTLIQNAHTWATTLFIWLDLVMAKTTNTNASQEYYDYPEEFRSGSIIRLAIDGESYDRKNFEDYLDFKENNTGSDEKIFANYGRFFFVNPTPASLGSGNMDVWGAVQADELSEGTSETIFTGNKPEGNEAIVLKAFSVAMRRIDKTLSDGAMSEAILTLSKLHGDEVKATQRDQRKDHPKFDVPDFFGGISTPTPGRFSYRP
jgi:hypothetical protein